MKAVMNELEKSPDVILFIDEIHTIVGAGGASGSLDASNMFKPALARGEVQCIGATTLDEYRQYIEKDGALERRFQKVMVEPTSIEETKQILNNIKDKYEEHHSVKYTDAAIAACVARSEFVPASSTLMAASTTSTSASASAASAPRAGGRTRVEVADRHVSCV